MSIVHNDKICYIDNDKICYSHVQDMAAEIPASLKPFLIMSGCAFT